MTSALPTPPDPFPQINVQTLKAGTELHRNHASGFRPAQFNPCKGQPTRFAPFTDLAGNCVPTLYAATSREAAAFESIFHDIDASARFKSVRIDTVVERTVSIIAPQRDLVVASLFAPDLKRWSIRRSDLIETPKSTYTSTVIWAAALHRARPDLQGLIWTSRQCDPERCVLLFGDRLSEADFEIVEQKPVATHHDILMELRGFGRRAGIDIVV